MNELDCDEDDAEPIATFEDDEPATAVAPAPFVFHRVGRCYFCRRVTEFRLALPFLTGAQALAIHAGALGFDDIAHQRVILPSCPEHVEQSARKFRRPIIHRSLGGVN